MAASLFQRILQQMVKRFSKGDYRTLMLSRSKERLSELEKIVPNSRSFPCDVSNEIDMEKTINQIKSEEGIPDVLIHNAVRGSRGNFLEIKTKDLLEDIFNNCQMARYTPFDYVDMDKDYSRALEIISLIDKEIK